jgi:hypothetical protein
MAGAARLALDQGRRRVPLVLPWPNPTETRPAEAVMIRLALLLFIVIGASLAGTFVVAALVAGFDTAQPIIWAAAAGFAAAVPASLAVARRLG